LKLLRIIRSLNPYAGGPVEGLISSTPILTSYGIETTVASLDAPSCTWLQNLPFDTLPLGPALGGYGFSRAIIPSIKQALRTADAVIVEGLWQYHVYAAWRALRFSGIPYYVYPHGMLDPWFNEVYPLKYFKKKLYWPFVDSKVLRDSSGVLFTSEAELFRSRRSFTPYQVREYLVGYGASKLTHPSSYQLNQYFTSFPSLIGKDILLFIGRIHPKKGVDYLIQAFAHYAITNPNLHLVLAGPVDTSYRRTLSTLIESLSISNSITWTGHLSGPMKLAAFATADLFCLPSHQENFGVSVAESLSIGLPVCISSSVNISVAVEASSAGIVHPPTLSGTFSGLHRWLTTTPLHRSQMSENASKLYSRDFNWSKSVSLLSSLLLNPGT